MYSLTLYLVCRQPTSYHINTLDVLLEDEVIAPAATAEARISAVQGSSSLGVPRLHIAPPSSSRRVSSGNSLASIIEAISKVSVKAGNQQ